ncbi:hypothetical protein SALBM311S_12940 [Streptomyces alboniger]
MGWAGSGYSATALRKAQPRKPVLSMPPVMNRPIARTASAADGSPARAASIPARIPRSARSR